MLDLWCSILEKFVLIFNEIAMFLFKLKAEVDCFYVKFAQFITGKEIVFITMFVVLSVVANYKLLNYIPKKCFKLAPVKMRYFTLSLIYTVGGFLIYYLFNHFFVIVFLLVFLNFTVLLFILDYKTGYLPNVLTYPLLWLGLLYQIATPAGNIISAIYAVMVAYLIVLALTALVGRIKKQPQMGGGDLKLIAACAAWLGVLNLPYFLGLAAGLGLLQYGVNYWLLPKLNKVKGNALQVGEKNMDNMTPTIPFGPAILMSASIWLYLSLIHP